MTGQISDSLRLDGESFQILGIDGDTLFDPSAHGLKPTTIHTACWRGWYAGFAVRDGALVLADLTVNDADGNYPALNGVVPAAPRSEPRAGGPPFTPIERTYRDVGLPLSFTGTLTVGTDFIQELYVHMGYQTPDRFRRVLDLRFEGGTLVETTDRSAEMEAARSEGTPSVWTRVKKTLLGD